MKNLFLTMAITALISSYSAHSAASTTYLIQGHASTKLEALKSLIERPTVEVTRCQSMELTDKATLKAKPERPQASQSKN